MQPTIVLMDVPVNEIKSFTEDLVSFFEAKYSQLVREIDEKKVLTDEVTEQIVQAVKEFKK